MDTTTKTVSAVCPKCGGSGEIQAFGHIAYGRCFTCGGTGAVAVDFALGSGLWATRTAFYLALDTLAFRDGAIVVAKSGKVFASLDEMRALYKALRMRASTEADFGSARIWENEARALVASLSKLGVPLK